MSLCSHLYVYIRIHMLFILAYIAKLLSLTTGLDSSCLQFASRESAVTSQIQHGGPDFRRHAVPVRDRLREARIDADILQPLATTLDGSTILQNDLRSQGRGCNSRRRPRGML